MRIKDLLVFCLLLFSTNIIAQTKDSKLSIWHKKNIGFLDFPNTIGSFFTYLQYNFRNKQNEIV